jgi:hypothetical protein
MEESAMPADSTSLIGVFLLIFGAVISGFAIAGAIIGWRWRAHYRRIDKHLGRR